MDKVVVSILKMRMHVQVVTKIASGNNGTGSKSTKGA